jgi:hypothetical protein
VKKGQTMKTSGVNGCSFLLGASGLLMVALAGELPKDASTYTLRATPSEIIVKAGIAEIARFPFSNSEIFNELAKLSTIGTIECPEGAPFPGEVTNLMYVETMRGSA